MIRLSAIKTEAEGGKGYYYLSIGIDRHRSRILDTNEFDIGMDGTYRANTYAGSGNAAAYWDAAGALRRDNNSINGRIDFASHPAAEATGAIIITVEELEMAGFDLVKAIKRLDAYVRHTGVNAISSEYISGVRIESERIVVLGNFNEGDVVQVYGEYNNYLDM